MTWFGVLLIVIYIIGVLSTVLTVGEPRKPITPGLAAISVGLALFLIAGILFVGTGTGL